MLLEVSQLGLVRGVAQLLQLEVTDLQVGQVPCHCSSGACHCSSSTTLDPVIAKLVAPLSPVNAHLPIPWILS
jgi:hypothetical protein